MVRDGALLYERYGGECGEASLHLSQSVGKSVLGLHRRHRRRRPGGAVTDSCPRCGASGYAGATVRHLLDMTAAIDFVEDYAVDFVALRRRVRLAPADRRRGRARSSSSCRRSGRPPGAHGERLHYATPEHRPARARRRARRRAAPLAQVIATRLWAPLGAERDAGLTVDPAGTAAIGGGFCATLRDYARLGALVVRGRSRHRRARLGRRARRARAIVRPTDRSSAPRATRNQWWRRDGRVDCARGIHGQLHRRRPDAGRWWRSSRRWPDAVDPSGATTAQRALIAAGHRVASARRPPPRPCTSRAAPCWKPRVSTSR